jgi:DNA-binding transcriptional regulator GbsR (MarR family)
MSQVEVLGVLEKSNVPMSAKEIAEILKIREPKVHLALKTMCRINEVDFIILNRKLAMKFYKTKRSMKLYFVV